MRRHDRTRFCLGHFKMALQGFDEWYGGMPTWCVSSSPEEKVTRSQHMFTAFVGKILLLLKKSDKTRKNMEWFGTMYLYISSLSIVSHPCARRLKDSIGHVHMMTLRDVINSFYTDLIEPTLPEAICHLFKSESASAARQCIISSIGLDSLM